MANIPGSVDNDALVGTTEDDLMTGVEGVDTLFGSEGNDTLDGGDDADTANYSGSLSAVIVNLTTGLGSGGDAEGDEYISIENVVGSGLDDEISGNGVANRLDGGAGNDLIFTDAGSDTLVGGSGFDTVSYATSSNGVTISLAGGAGVGGNAQGDVLSGIEALIGSSLSDRLTGDGAANSLTGGFGNDSLIGGAGNDTLNADEGNDLVKGGTGNDVLNGGAGVDILDYSDISTGVTVNLTTGLTGLGAGIDSVSGFEVVIGSLQNDTITGSAGNDTLVGAAGADSIVGGAGIDQADYTSSQAGVVVNLLTNANRGGDAQGDVLSGIEIVVGSSAFNDSITGDTGNNALYGLDGNDSLIGGDGNDTLDGGLGSKDSMTGGAGDDTYFVDSTNDRVSESTAGGRDIVFSSATFTLSLQVEDLTLTGTGNIDGTGNSSENIIIGNDGNNALSGGSLNDALTGNNGNDTLNGGSGIDTMEGGNGDDAYFIDELLDVISEAGGSGNDTVNSGVTWTLTSDFENLTLTGTSAASGTGNGFDNVITGNTGDNALTGLGGDDSISGGNGDDTIDGGSGSNTLAGGDGDDLYLLSSGLDVVNEFADEGVDTIQTDLSYALDLNVENLTLTGLANSFAIGNELDNEIIGNDGNNQISADAGNDTITAGLGNDTLNGGLGIDSMLGGAGDDVYIVDDAGDKTIEGATVGVDSVGTFVSFTLAANIENMTLLGFDAIDGIGNSLNNLMTGNENTNVLSGANGADSIEGLGGSDTLNGGLGADTLEGGEGNDVYVVDVDTDITTELADEGTDEVQSSTTWTLGDNIEALTLLGSTGLSGTGNTLNNTITGNGGANALNGNEGVDTLIGGNGNDTLNGGVGADSMVGGLGNDTYVLSSLSDVVVEALDEGIDTIRIALSYTLSNHVENLALNGTGNFSGTGSAISNVLTGNTGDNNLQGLDGADTIVGGSGDDTLDGGLGIDSMTGGLGADTYIVDDGLDKIVEASGPATDSVFASVTYTLATNVENLTLTDDSNAINGTGNSAANTLTGSDSANMLKGLGGNDTLVGNGGNDTLDGGIGNDDMSGGLGNDVYIVNSLTDIVTELNAAGRDRVQSSVNYTLGANLEDLTLTGTSRINATGNAVANEIIGNDANNRISAMEGNDTVTGGLGADTFVFLAANNGTDRITDFNGLVSGVAEGDVMSFAAASLVGTFDYVGAAGFSGGSDNSEARIASGGRVLMDMDGDGISDMTIFLTGLTVETQLTAADFVFA